MSDLAPYFSARADVLPFYAPCPFIRPLDQPQQVQKHVIAPLVGFGQHPEEQLVSIEISGASFLFFVKKLTWDTQFFGIETFRLINVLYTNQDFDKLCAAVSHFKTGFFQAERRYLFSEIPSEDIRLVSALTSAGFRLIETRLKYYRPLSGFANERFPVRLAAQTDIANLREVAAQMRNAYDRFHAEPAFDPDLGDSFLAKYAEEAVKGYCEAVLIPDEPGIPTRAFMALKYLAEEIPLAQILLSAVAPECRGWHYKLLSECLLRAKESDKAYLGRPTQTPNRAVIRNCEKLGFSLGALAIFCRIVINRIGFPVGSCQCMRLKLEAQNRKQYTQNQQPAMHIPFSPSIPA